MSEFGGLNLFSHADEAKSFFLLKPARKLERQQTPWFREGCVSGDVRHYLDINTVIETAVFLHQHVSVKLFKGWKKQSCPLLFGLVLWFCGLGFFFVVVVFILCEDPGDRQGRAENRVDQRGSPPHSQPQAARTEACLAEDIFLLSKLVLNVSCSNQTPWNKRGLEMQVNFNLFRKRCCCSFPCWRGMYLLIWSFLLCHSFLSFPRAPLLRDRVTHSHSVRIKRDIGSLGAVVPAYVCKERNC